MDELETLPICLSCIEQQSYPQIKVIICINQPESFWSDDSKKAICVNNVKTIEYIAKYNRLNVTIIDKSSQGNGWTNKKYGVGWARKTTMDYIASIADKDDIIICMDADTTFNNEFCCSIEKAFSVNKNAVGMALPYYHRLTGDDTINRCVLRYEIYMRYYVLNLFRIRNPYCFTAIGSSMATTVKVYRSVKGISPKISGEDFYFLQKLRKHGSLIIWNQESTFPATRYSERVFFGTGPALIKGRRNQWESYPLYSYLLFDKVKQTYDMFDILFKQDIETPMSEFLEIIFNTKELWQPIRDNFKSLALFRKSCAEKVDGLRILQFMKFKQNLSDNEEKYLIEFLRIFFPQKFSENEEKLNNFNFENSSINVLDSIRRILCEIENDFRKQFRIIDWY